MGRKSLGVGQIEESMMVESKYRMVSQSVSQSGSPQSQWHVQCVDKGGHSNGDSYTFHGHSLHSRVLAMERHNTTRHDPY